MSRTVPAASRGYASWAIWALAACGIGGWTVAVVRYPFREATYGAEPFLTAYPLACGVTVAGLFLMHASCFPTWRTTLQAATIAILGGILFFSATNREFELERIRWKFDGVVAERYLSTNHGAKSILIRGRPCGAFESMESATWESLKPGDHVVKEAYSLSVYVNGESKPFVLGRIKGKARAACLR